MGGHPAKRTTLALAGVVALAGCGGGERQDAHEPRRTFPVEITRAQFPADQHIARSVEMHVAVRNAGRQAIPNVALTVENKDSPGRGGAFGQAVDDPSLSNPSRVVWVLDRGPASGVTAYVGTWALGRLAPGKTKDFAFALTPVRPGRYALTYRVAAGLTGAAKANVAGGGPAEGSFDVRVSGVPADAVTNTPAGG